MVASVFDEIRDEMARLRRDRPGAVLSSGETKRAHVELSAHETELAARLHETYAPFLDITVGAFRYPLPTKASRQPLPVADTLTVAWDGEPPSVRSGTTLRTDVLVTNSGAQRVELHTDGDLRGEVIDPVSRELVGHFVGFHEQPLVVFAIDPGQTRGVPVLIGTASTDPSLGYAVPAGRWAVIVELPLATGVRESAPLPLVVRENPGVDAQVS